MPHVGLSAHLVQHEYETAEGEDRAKMIGIISSEIEAQKAIEMSKHLPRFSDYPDSYTVDETRLDELHWKEGFQRMNGFGPVD